MGELPTNWSTVGGVRMIALFDAPAYRTRRRLVVRVVRWRALPVAGVSRGSIQYAVIPNDEPKQAQIFDARSDALMIAADMIREWLR